MQIEEVGSHEVEITKDPQNMLGRFMKLLGVKIQYHQIEVCQDILEESLTILEGS